MLTVVTISVCCIAITVIASCIIIPVTFALDSEEADIVKKWLLISDEAKQVVLKNINEFVNYL